MKRLARAAFRLCTAAVAYVALCIGHALVWCVEQVMAFARWVDEP